MLWRASQICRHLPLANLLLSHSRDSVITIPIWQRIRCGSAAVAVQVRAVARQPSPTHQHQGQGASKLPSQTLQRSLVATLPQPAPDLVAMVDTLYTRRREGDTTKEDLKKYADFPKLLDHLRNREQAVELAALMVNTSVPHRAIRVLILAHDVGSRFTQSMYERIAYQLAQTRQWSELPALVSLGQIQSGRTTVRLLNWRTRALVEISQYRLLDNVLSDFEQARIQPNRRTFNTLVSGHLRNHDLEKAQDCLEWMQNAGFPMDASTHALLTAGYRSFGPDQSVKQRALAQIPKMKAKDGSVVVNSLLQVAVDTDDRASVRQYISLFVGPLGVAGRELDNNLALSPELGAISWSSVSRRTLPHPTGIHPDVITFTILVNYGAKAKKYEFAMQMIKRMKAHGIAPDSYFAASLIRLHGSTERFPTALDISATLCHDNTTALPPLRELGWQGDLYPDLEASQVSHSHQTVNALLKASLHITGLKGFLTISQFMRALGLKHNEHTIETFIRYLTRNNRIRPRELVQILRALSKDVSPTILQLNIVFAALLRQQRAQATPSGWNNLARRVRARQDGRRNAPRATDDQRQSLSDSESPATDKPNAAGASATQLYRDLMEPIVASLTERRVLSDGDLIKNIIRYEGIVKGNVESADAQFKSMLKRGIYPTKYHYSALIEGYCRVGNMLLAKNTLASARTAGFATDPAMYTIIMDGYAMISQPTHAMRVFKQMLQYRVHPDVAAVDALARAYYVSGFRGKARWILLWYWHFFGRFPPEMHSAPLEVLAKEFRKLGSARQNPWADRSDERKNNPMFPPLWRWKDLRSGEYSGLRGRVGRRIRLSPRGRMVYQMYLSESKTSK